MTKRYIGADEAIKAITDLPNCYNGFSDTYDKACIIGVLEELPTADAAEVKHGRWVHDGYDFPHGNDWIHCSVCGKRGINVPTCLTPYCPNCGAKMEGKQDD